MGTLNVLETWKIVTYLIDIFFWETSKYDMENLKYRNNRSQSSLWYNEEEHTTKFSFNLKI